MQGDEIAKSLFWCLFDNFKFIFWSCCDLFEFFMIACLTTNHIQITFQVTAGGHRWRSRYPLIRSWLYNFKKWRVAIVWFELLHQLIELIFRFAQKRHSNARIHRVEFHSSTKSLVIGFVKFDFINRFFVAHTAASLCRVWIKIKNLIVDIAEKVKRLIRSTADNAERWFDAKALFQSIHVDRIELIQAQSEWDYDEQWHKFIWFLTRQTFIGRQLMIESDVNLQISEFVIELGESSKMTKLGRSLSHAEKLSLFDQLTSRLERWH